MAIKILKSLIRLFEGLRLRAYPCPAGVWTAMYGATGPDIKPGMMFSVGQAEVRLGRDAGIAMRATMKLCPGLAGPQLAAIADFTYNLGATRLAGSTLRRRVNAGDIHGAYLELQKWVFGGGRKLPGLIRRRQAEGNLLIGAVNVETA